jgi:ribonuclease T2
MKRIVSSGILCCLGFLLLFVPAARAKRKHLKSNAQFDYYLLSLSWAPNFCSSHPSDHSSECTRGNHTAFVLHGLWPQSNSGLPPMACTPASPVAKRIVDHMLGLMPTRNLIQHEWEKHGTCSGLSAADYFTQVEQSFKSVKVPQQYPALTQEQQLSVYDVEVAFARENHAPEQAFRISCHGGYLVGLEVCLTKDLQFQACTKSVHECPANQVRLRSPQ